MRLQWHPAGHVSDLNQSHLRIAWSNAVVSTLYRQLWTPHWTPAPSTLNTMSPILRTRLASPVSWWLLHFSPHLRSSEFTASYYCSLIRLQTTRKLLEHSCCKLNPAALFALRLIEKLFFITAAVSRGPTHLLSPLQLDIRQQCERKWSDLHPFLVADPTWLLLLDYLFWVRAVCA